MRYPAYRVSCLLVEKGYENEINTSDSSHYLYVEIVGRTIAHCAMYYRHYA